MMRPTPATMRMLMAAMAAALVCSNACVRNTVYNPVPRSIVAVMPSSGAIDELDADCVPEDGTPCLAFIEFDEMGEFWDRTQVDEAVKLIERASKGPKPPLVLTFVHGWKNNANDGRHKDGTDDARHKSGNVLGFEGVLEYLAKGEYKGGPVVGIYIGWRGDFSSRYWPIRRQFTYFNRERTAIRIPGSSMTEALTRIMIETRRFRAGSKVVMIGHSFGALVLERALTQAMTDYVLRTAGGAHPETAIDAAHADLVVYVNSAAAATEGKQMIDLLKRVQANRSTGGSRNQPLFLSISSLGDAATRFAMPLGHGPSFLGFRNAGSWRDYEHPDPPDVKSQKSYYLSTTAHMQALQSHLVVQESDAAECSGATVIAGPFTLPNSVQYRICEKPGRWNDTRYWAMQMPASIVRDHSGIFTENFIDLLRYFPTDTQVN